MSDKTTDEKLDALYEVVCGPGNSQSMMRELLRIAARQEVFEARFKTLLGAIAFIGTVFSAIAAVWNALRGGN